MTGMPMTQRKDSRKPNGHAADSTERDALPVHREFAASDVATGAAAAGTATASAGCTGSGAHADAAHAEAHLRGSRETGASPRPNGRSKTPAAAESPAPSLPDLLIRETDIPLPADPGSFVDEVHRHVDLVQQWIELLKSQDEKIRQRAIERLTDMKYKDAAPVEEPRHIVIDIPRPNRNLVPRETVESQPEEKTRS